MRTTYNPAQGKNKLMEVALDLKNLKKCAIYTARTKSTVRSDIQRRILITFPWNAFCAKKRRMYIYIEKYARKHTVQQAATVLLPVFNVVFAGTNCPKSMLTVLTRHRG